MALRYKREKQIRNTLVIIGIVAIIGGISVVYGKDIYAYYEAKAKKLENVPMQDPVQSKPIINEAPSKKLDTSLIASYIHNMVNHERIIKGLPALSWDEKLASIALSHSKDMVLNGYSHTGSDGSDPHDRITKYISDCTSWAENIDHFKRNGNEQEIADLVVSRWMGSTLHRVNILSDLYNEGIGVTQSNDGWTFITQDFC